MKAGLSQTGGGRRGGFTLAELIVATTMIAIIMSAVYTAFNSAITAWRIGEANYQTYQDARLGLDLLGRELNAMALGAHGWMKGTRNELEFFTVSPPMDVESGSGAMVMKVTYRLTAGDVRRGRTLVREEEVVDGPLPVAPDCAGVSRAGRVSLGRKRTFVVAEGVREFSLTYHWAPELGRDRNEPPAYPAQMIVQTQHKECWGSPAALGVRLTLDDPNAGNFNHRTTFTHYVTFRFNTSPMPQELRHLMWTG